MSSRRSSSKEAQDNGRKRVCKACDRCRLKKSKCDGAIPCSRCKADNAICVFGERKKSQDKVYPKGYVEMLEQQQTQLVAGLQELYSRLEKGQGWPGQSLPESPSGHPLTHNILERLHLLHLSKDGSHYEGFEEDCSRMQQTLLDQGAPFSRRRASVSSDSDHDHDHDHDHLSSTSSHRGTPTTTSFAVDSPYARPNAPPTPPMSSGFLTRAGTAPAVKPDSPMSPIFLDAGALDPSTLSRAPLIGDAMMLEEPVEVDFKPMYGYESFAGYNQGMMMDTIAMTSMDPMMPDWTTNADLDFTTFLQNPPVNV